MAYIYKIWNDINNKVYIGKTNRSLKTRFHEHCRDSKKDNRNNRPLYKAMNKYGVENFHIEELEETSRELSSERECYWIGYYNSFHNGYNATKGGDGKPWVDEDEIISLFESGKSKAEIRKITKHDVSVIHSVLQDYYTKEQLDRSTYAAKHKTCKSVAKLDLNTREVLEVYESIKEARRKIGKNLRINLVCDGRRNSAGGFGWAYYKEDGGVSA